MQHETTINELADMNGLSTTIDHITVTETHPDTGTGDQYVIPFDPPPLIRRTTRRDDTPEWILSPAGHHHHIHVADQAPVTVYFKDVDTGRFTGHLPPPPQQQTPMPPAGWPPQPATYTTPTSPAAPQQAPTRQRPAAPWTQNPT